MQAVPKRGAAPSSKTGHLWRRSDRGRHRIPVHSVVIQWRHYRDIDRVRSALPRLDNQEIETALAFYEANQQSIVLSRSTRGCLLNRLMHTAVSGLMAFGS